MNKNNYSVLSRSIGHQFEDEELLQLALTHRSYRGANNERLEFLGDAILNFCIAEALYTKYPEAAEGQLSRLRSEQVKGETLAEIAREHKLGEYLILGEGELKSGGNRRDSILADSVEAIIGAIYLDAGFEACRQRILHWYTTRLAALSLAAHAKDPKTQLQELLQGRQQPLPHYEVVKISGQAHSQDFIVACRVSVTSKVTEGRAGSRKMAEKKAAQAMLDHLVASVSLL